MINKEILDIFKTQGITKGDILLVSSDVTQLLIELCGGIGNLNRVSAKKICNDIIDTLQSLLGKEGTLLFPTYNWGWCQSKPFNYEKTLGETGALSNIALKRVDFKRTKHPIYSFAVWGKDKKLLVDMDNKDSFGQDSPFAYLHKNKAKNLFIDVSSFYTFAHYVEESVGVNYRFIKNFKSTYVSNNVCEERVYSMYVRNLDMKAENPDMNFELLVNNGCCKFFKIANIDCGIIDMEKTFDVYQDDILNNKSRNLIKFV